MKSRRRRKAKMRRELKRLLTRIESPATPMAYRVGYLWNRCSQLLDQLMSRTLWSSLRKSDRERLNEIYDACRGATR